MNSTQGTSLLNELGDKVQLKAVGGYNDAQVFKSPRVCTPRVRCIALAFLAMQKSDAVQSMHAVVTKQYGTKSSDTYLLGTMYRHYLPLRDLSLNTFLLETYLPRDLSLRYLPLRHLPLRHLPLRHLSLRYLSPRDLSLRHLPLRHLPLRYLSPLLCFQNFGLREPTSQQTLLIGLLRWQLQTARHIRYDKVSYHRACRTTVAD